MTLAGFEDISGEHLHAQARTFAVRSVLRELTGSTAVVLGALARLYPSLGSSISSASIPITVVEPPADGETLTIEDRTLTFRVLGPEDELAEDDIEVLSTAELQAEAIRKAMNGLLGTGVGPGTQADAYFAAERTGAVLTLTARKGGPDGDLYSISTDSTDITIGILSPGSGDYPILKGLVSKLAAASLFSGGSVDGRGQESYSERLAREANELLARLASGSIPLSDVSGAVVAMSGLAFQSTAPAPGEAAFPDRKSAAGDSWYTELLERKGALY